MASQMGKTAGLLNVIGHRLQDDPAPLIYVGPTRHHIDHVIEPKVMDLLRGVPALWEKLAQGKQQSKTHKRIGGVSLRLAWAGSATELASDSAVLVLVDEIDRMDSNVQGEGSVMELAEARTSTYPDGRVVGTSTPTLGQVETFKHPVTGIEHWAISDSVVSPVWRLWQEGSRHEWAWSCPHCAHYFIPRFKHLWWPEGASPEVACQQAALACPRCGGLILDSERHRLNSQGVFLAPGQWVEKEHVCGIADTAGCDMASFWVSGLCSFSPKKTFGFLAKKVVAALKSGEPERVQGVINTDFGELFGQIGEAPLWTAVAERRKPYRQGEVPEPVVVLTAGVDVQKDRLVYVVRGWAEDLESWLIEHGELWGETDKPEVWQRLSGFVQSRWQEQGLSWVAIDSGYQTQAVYRFCRLHPGLALATKGHDALDKPFKRVALDVGVRGQSLASGLALWHFNSDQMKSWVHARMDWPLDQPGGWWLPEDISEDYCKQIVAEQRTVNSLGKVTWVKIKRENHYLDCEALAYLVVRMMLGGREEGISKPRPQRRPGVIHPGIRFVGGEIVDPPPMGEWVQDFFRQFDY